jgi:hypothetical protein
LSLNLARFSLKMKIASELQLEAMAAEGTAAGMVKR